MSYIGQGLPADTFQGFVTDSFTGDGSATTFTLSKEPFSEDTLIVVINNVIQKPTTNFTVSGTTLTIVGTAVASGDVIYAIHMGGPLPIGGASELDLNGASDKLILDADADTTISADTDDQIDIKVGGSDVVTLGPSNLTVDIGGNIRLDADDNGEVRLLDGGTQYGALKVDSSRLKIQGIVSDADMLFAVNDGGSEVTALTLDASAAGLAIFNAGVAIGGTGSANTLDDYEEGTFTPSFSGASGAPSGVNYNYRTASYTKIGRLVTCSIYMALSSWSSGPSGDMIVSGLPFTCRNNTDSYAGATVGYCDGFISSDAPQTGYVPINNTKINMQTNQSSDGRDDLRTPANAGNMSGDETIIISTSYHTDA